MLGIKNISKRRDVEALDKYSISVYANVTVLGVVHTGKTTLINNMTGDYQKSSQQAREITTKWRTDPTSDDQFVKISVLETADLARYHSITRGYHRRMNAVIMTVNGNFEYSVLRVMKWISDFRSHGRQEPLLTVVVNTFDIDYPTPVSNWQPFIDLCKEHNVIVRDDIEVDDANSVQHLLVPILNDAVDLAALNEQSSFSGKELATAEE